jgi:hypothetical protein
LSTEAAVGFSETSATAAATRFDQDDTARRDIGPSAAAATTEDRDASAVDGSSRSAVAPDATEVEAQRRRGAHGERCAHLGSVAGGTTLSKRGHRACARAPLTTIERQVQ